MGVALSEIFSNVERYVGHLITHDYSGSLEKEENRVLALQYVNRLNHRIGRLATEKAADPNELRALQTYVNGLTVGLKNNNLSLTKSSLLSIRNMISAMEKEKSQE